MELNPSDELLLIMKAFQLLGIGEVDRGELISTYIILRDMLGKFDLPVEEVTTNYIYISYLEGLINMLLKLGILDCKNDKLRLSERGERILNNILSSKKGLQTIKLIFGILETDAKLRNLYAIYLAYKSVGENKDELEFVGEKYRKFKNDVLSKAYREFKPKVKKKVE